MQAYKGIQKEKEALEASLRVLTASTSAPTSDNIPYEEDEINNDSTISEGSSNPSALPLSSEKSKLNLQVLIVI